MADPLAQFDEVRPNGRRHFELFADKVVVDSRSARADSVITVMLADLRPEPNILRVRPKKFKLGVGSLLIAIVLGFVAFAAGTRHQPMFGKSMIWVGASAGFLVASLAIIAKTVSKAVPYGVATLLSLADGTTSMYFSNGSAVIGGHSHENVRAASAMFLSKTNELLGSMTPAQQAPLPESGRVAFCARTDDGLLTANFAESELKAGTHAFSPLFFAGHIVIGELRKTSQKQPAAAG